MGANWLSSCQRRDKRLDRGCRDKCDKLGCSREGEWSEIDW